MFLCVCISVCLCRIAQTQWISLKAHHKVDMWCLLETRRKRSTLAESCSQHWWLISKKIGEMSEVWVVLFIVESQGWDAKGGGNLLKGNLAKASHRTEHSSSELSLAWRFWCWWHNLIWDRHRRVGGKMKVSLKRWIFFDQLSSLKGLRAESARAVTGRRCPHSGEGEDFLKGQPDFFTKTAVTRERKVEKLFSR